MLEMHDLTEKQIKNYKTLFDVMAQVMGDYAPAVHELNIRYIGKDGREYRMTEVVVRPEDMSISQMVQEEINNEKKLGNTVTAIFEDKGEEPIVYYYKLQDVKATK